MNSSFPNTCDRADVLMSAGCSTFVSAALILVMPRVGIVMLEILLGLFLIGCALAARVHLGRKTRAEGSASGLSKTKPRWFDRYDALMIVAVIVVQNNIAQGLRHAGLSEGTVRMFPLVLLGMAILLKPRLLHWAEHRSKRMKGTGDGSGEAAVPEPATEHATAELWWQAHVHTGAGDRDLEKKGNN
jgi:hypothetical protein